MRGKRKAINCLKLLATVTLLKTPTEIYNLISTTKQSKEFDEISTTKQSKEFDEISKEFTKRSEGFGEKLRKNCLSKLKKKGLVSIDDSIRDEVIPSIHYCRIEIKKETTASHEIKEKLVRNPISNHYGHRDHLYNVTEEGKEWLTKANLLPGGREFLTEGEIKSIWGNPLNTGYNTDDWVDFFLTDERLL